MKNRWDYNFFFFCIIRYGTWSWFGGRRMEDHFASYLFIHCEHHIFCCLCTGRCATRYPCRFFFPSCLLFIISDLVLVVSGFVSPYRRLSSDSLSHTHTHRFSQSRYHMVHTEIQCQCNALLKYRMHCLNEN